MQIRYNSIYLLELDEVERKKHPSRSRYMVCENFLGVNFIKYNNNNGYVLKKDG